MAPDFDLRRLPSSFYDNPFPTYHALRTHTPILDMPDGSLFLTRHADLVAVYRNAKTFSSAKDVEFTPKFGAGSPLLAHHTTSLIFNDPPRHTRVRKLISGALTARVIADMEPGLIMLVDGLLDRIDAKGSFDLIADFAAAIPSSTRSNLPQRVIRAKRSGSSVSMLTFTRRTPDLASPTACLASCVPFVVSVSSSSPCPSRAPSRSNSVITPRRTNGSPPVIRSLRTPWRMKAAHSVSSSSRLSTSALGRNVMSSAMQ